MFANRTVPHRDPPQYAGKTFEHLRLNDRSFCSWVQRAEHVNGWVKDSKVYLNSSDKTVPQIDPIGIDLNPSGYHNADTGVVAGVDSDLPNTVTGSGTLS
jgi:hypothetical protein